jgi:hypothetical protein
MQIGSRVARRLALMGLVVLATAGPARAVQFSLEVLVGGVSAGTVDGAALGCSSGEIIANCSKQNLAVGNLLIENLSLFLDADPIISGVVAVQNLAGSTQQFTMIFTLITAPIGPSSLTGGSVAGGVTDNNGNGATLSTISKSALYTALIDGATHQTLFPHLTSLSAGAYDSADLTPPGAFGTPIPSQAGPAVATSIGIKYDFNLTSQDSASFTGVFVVQPIPEPATALLLGLGLAVVAGASRRR